MRVGIYAVGRLKAGPEKELASRYLDRFAKAGPGCGLEFLRSVEIAESRASNAATRKREEAAELLKAMPEGALVILLDTPGGLDTSMRQIIQTIMDSNVPVIVYVHPSGARAASAGSIIMLASHIAAMTPGTNTGAANPVRIGVGIKRTKRWRTR